MTTPTTPSSASVQSEQALATLRHLRNSPLTVNHHAGLDAAIAALSHPAASQAAINYVPGEWFEAKDRDQLEAFFVSRLPAIREAAKEHGYAVGLHGSLRRDMDLIAVPWRDGASDKDALAHAIAQAACGITRNGPYQWESKPVGRVATSISCCWPSWYGEAGAGHIDLSVMAQATHPQQPSATGGDGEPVPMILHCPKCGMQHVDAPDERDPYPSSTGEDDHEPWMNPPHRSHLCHGCGTIWRPADVATVGVKAIATRGKADNWTAQQADGKGGEHV